MTSSASRRSGRGVFYVATQKVSFAAEAVLSVWSLKERNPGLHVTIASDLVADCPVLFERFFDRVMDISGLLALRRRRSETDLDSWGRGIRQRVRCLRETPYEQTLFIDTDTRVHTPRLSRLFARLERCNVALVEARPDMSTSCQLWGRRMFLGGVMLYDSSPATLKLLRAWDRLAGEHYRLATRRRFVRPSWLPARLDEGQARFMLAPSQVSLARLVGPDRGRRGLAVHILPRTWNYRDADARKLPRDVKIDAGGLLRDRLLDDLVRLSRWLWKRGDAAYARRFDAFIRRAVRERLLA